jgi:glycosyltransferase involved in cell wall biosynthesis
MKVLQINAVFEILSTGRSYKETSDYLWAYGHECESIYGEYKRKSEHSHYLGNVLSHKSHAFLTKLLGDFGYGSILDTYKLINYISHFKPDVIHIGNLHANFVNIPILFKYIARHDIPVIITLHDCYFFTGGCMHYTTNGCYKWKCDCRNCQFLHRGQDYWLTNTSQRNLKHKIKLFHSIPRLGVIGVSDWITNEAKHSLVFSKAKLFDRVYDWIDLNRFKPQGKDKDQQTKTKLGIDGKFMILGVSSTWNNKKGLDDFISLSRKLTDNQIIVLVGNLENDVKLPDNIIDVKSTNNVDELVEYYSASDVFVNLSLEETFGKVTAEALGCGTPIIVYNSTANPELVGDGCGYIIDEPHNISSIFDCITTIATNSKEAYSSYCRQKAVFSFNKDKNIGCQIKIYERLIKSI